MSVVLRLQLALVPADRGGRRRPMADGYRASLSFGRRRRGDAEPVVHDAVLVLEDAATLAPGATGVARAYVLLGDELPRALDPVFTLLEGDRIVARAELLGVYEDPAPHALRDVAAAKQRQLRPTLQGERVTLRAPRPGDARDRDAAGRDPEVARGYGVRLAGPEPVEPGHGRAWVERLAAEPWAWVIARGGHAIGHIRLEPLGDAGQAAFVSLGLLRGDLLGRGFGTDALRTLMAWAAGPPLALRRLRLRVLEDNERALRSYAKCGFAPVGREERAVELDGRWYADVVMEATL